MDFRRIKAVLFIVVFLLVMAVAVNLLLDMQSARQEVDVGANAPDEFVPPVTFVPDTPAQTQTPVYTPATQVPVATPAPTEVTVYTPVATPSPSPTPEPTPTPIPVGQQINSGMFMSDTGVPINIRALWTATVEDAEHVKVTVEVYLDSYQINIIPVDNAVHVRVGDQYASAGAPEIHWDQNVQIETLLAVTEHMIYLPQGTANEFSFHAEYHFGGVYSKQELPVIDCGGSIWLQR